MRIDGNESLWCRTPKWAHFAHEIGTCGCTQLMLGLTRAINLDVKSFRDTVPLGNLVFAKYSLNVRPLDALICWPVIRHENKWSLARIESCGLSSGWIGSVAKKCQNLFKSNADCVACEQFQRCLKAKIEHRKCRNSMKRHFTHPCPHTIPQTAFTVYIE